MALFVWTKPVLTFYRDRIEQPERKPFAVVQARKLTITLSENKTIEGNIQDFFALMGDLNYISSKEGQNDRYIICWFDEKEDDFNKAGRRLIKVNFEQSSKFRVDDKDKRTYNANFTAEFGKFAHASNLSKVIVGSVARMSVPTVTRSTTVFEVASVMAEKDIGAVIVVRDFEPLGMITERDIISRVVLSNRDPHEIIAQEIMTAPLITINYKRTIEEALEIMQRNRVRRLVVVKGESSVGLLTERRLLLACFVGNAEQVSNTQTSA
jgi:CBS domain-containing protein